MWITAVFPRAKADTSNQQMNMTHTYTRKDSAMKGMKYLYVLSTDEL